MVKLATVGVFAAVLLTVSGAGAETARSGFFEVEVGQIIPPGNQQPGAVASNILANPGFETGALPPWTTNNWSVTGADAHAGAFAAEDIGNFWIRQDFGSTPVGSINSISFWSKQPEEAIQAVDFYYGPVDFDEFLVFPLANWTFHDITSQLRGAGSLQAIRIWGYVGGGPDPDLTRIDDVVIDAGAATPVETATWGAIKGIYR